MDKLLESGTKFGIENDWREAIKGFYRNLYLDESWIPNADDLEFALIGH